MAVTIAKLIVKYGADTAEAIRGADQVNRSIQGVAEQNNRAASALGNVGKMAAGAAVSGVAALGGAMVATAYSGTNMAMDLESQMSTIAATMNTTADQVEPLKDMIQDLGLDPNLKVTTVEAAQAVDMLAKNGLAMTEIINGAAESTVLLANATGGEFAGSADIMTDVMAQFKDSAGSYMDAVSGIVSVTNASKFSIDDYGLAIAQAGGVASSVGVEFNDFNATIAAISPLFASGSDAGTSYKTFLQTLIPKSNEAADAMRELGIITADGSNRFFDAQGNLKSMAAVAAILQESMASLTEEQRNNAASTIFGTDAMRAAFGLMENGTVVYTDVATAAKELGVSLGEVQKVAEGGVTAFEALQLTMSKTDALEAAKTRTDNTRAALEILGGIVDDVKIRIGDAFLPIVRQMAEDLSAFVSQNSEGVTRFFESFANGVAAVVGAIPAMIQGVVSMAASVQSAISFVTDFYSALVNLVAVVQDAGARSFEAQEAISLFAQPFQSMVTTVLAVYGAIQGYASAVTDAGARSIEAREALSLFPQAIQGIIDTVTSAAEKLGSLFAPAIQRLTEAFAGVSGGISELSPKFAGLQGAFMGLVDALQPVIDMLAQALQFWSGTVVVSFLLGVNLIASAFQILPEVLGGVLETLTNLLNGLADIVHSAVALVVAVINGDWSGAWTAAQDLVSAFTSTVATLMLDLAMLLSTIVGGLYEAVVNTFKDLGLDIGSAVSEMTTKVTGYVGQILSVFESMNTWLTTTLISALNTFKEFINGLSLTNPFDVIQKAIGAVDLGISNLKKSFQAFKDWLSSLSVPNPFEGIANSLPSIPTWLGGSGGQQEQPAQGRAPAGPSAGSIGGRSSMQPVMASGYGNVYLTVNANVANDIDIKDLAYQMADMIKRRGR